MLLTRIGRLEDDRSYRGTEVVCSYIFHGYGCHVGLERSISTSYWE